jgi:class 3 adenylate cyclase
MAREFHFNRQWDLAASPEALWPFVSDTNRFNRDTGLPPMQMLGIRDGVKRVRFNLPLVNIEWEEEPFDWIFPYHFGILRRYRSGPLAEMRVAADLMRRPDGGTRLIYQVWARPANLLGWPAISLGIGLVSARRFERTFRSYDRLVQQGAASAGDPGRSQLSSSGRARLRSMQERLVTEGVDTSLLARLVDFLERADDISLQRMRPYALADLWRVERRPVLELFLKATRAGLLDMYWELLCPDCRGVTDSRPRLSDVHAQSHCNTCQIDFSANFDHNVEVVFRPNPSVRAIDEGLEFCVGSPQRQPHVVFSQTLPPREELNLNTRLESGRYTLRADGVAGSRPLFADKVGFESIDLRAAPEGWPYGETRVTLAPKLKLVNATDRTQTFKLERAAWSDQAATAADVTTLKVFRDLFSSEVLRPGEEISVGSVTLMFTDLRGSTRLYRQIGDAPAFGRVRDHFEVLETAIAREGGAIVKTMGDSVMAAFRHPIEALRAIWAAQAQIARRGEPPLWLKVGIHHGPCIVVTLNERLDYFGSTVNIAARLSAFSSGGEAVLSQPIHDDPEVISFLEQYARPNALRKFQTEVKGYDEPFDLWRLTL